MAPRQNLHTTTSTSRIAEATRSAWAVNSAGRPHPQTPRGRPVHFSQVAHPALAPRKFLTSVLIGPYSTCSSVTSHHMIFLLLVGRRPLHNHRVLCKSVGNNVRRRLLPVRSRWLLRPSLFITVQHLTCSFPAPSPLQPLSSRWRGLRSLLSFYRSSFYWIAIPTLAPSFLQMAASPTLLPPLLPFPARLPRSRNYMLLLLCVCAAVNNVFNGAGPSYCSSDSPLLLLLRGRRRQWRRRAGRQSQCVDER